MTDINYEKIVHEHDFQKSAMDDAFKIVEKWLMKKHRILVGGMAIDFAMRMKGSKLYPDDKFPDYDFYSPEFHYDAYVLGEEIAKDHTGVSVISALHASTMKVRLNIQEVADISYIPQNVYEKIPTLNYKKFTIVHPHFQMIDQHRSLSLPYEKPPLETMFGRWKKDIERYDLLNKYYPIDEPKFAKTYSTHSIPVDKLQNECLSGFVALQYWLNEAKPLGYISDVEFSIDKSVNVKLLEHCPFTILTNDIVGCKLFKKAKKIIRPLLDKISERHICDDIEVINDIGNLRAAYPIKSNLHVSNLQEVMCYLLTLGIFYDNKQALFYYCTAQKLLLWVSEQYAKTQDPQLLLFLPTADTYGISNTYDAYDLNRENIDVMFYSAERVNPTPRNAYPELGKPLDASLYQFRPQDTPIYQFDGTEVQN